MSAPVPAAAAGSAPVPSAAPASGAGAAATIWAQRAGAPSGGDRLYLVYCALLGAGVIGVPGLRTAAQALARPDVVPLLAAPAMPHVIAGALPLLAAAALGLGAVRGPAVLAPFLTSALASGPGRRRDALRRPFLRSLLLVVLLAIVLGALLGGTLLSAGSATQARLGTWMLFVLGCGLLLGAGWLAGEVLDARPRRIAALALLAASGLSAVLPPALGPGTAWPAAPAGELVSAGDGPVAPGSGAAAAAALALGIAAVALCFPLLDRVRGRTLLEQASRWDAAEVVAGSGDLAAAAGQFRPVPTTARRLRAVGPGGLLLLYLRRDAVAWLRTPERSLIAIAAAGAGGALLALPGTLPGPVGWTGAVAGALLLWTGAGALADGIRHGVSTLGAPPLFGQRAGIQLLLHGPAPTLALVGAGSLGAAAARAATTSSVPPVWALLPAVVAPALVAGRAWAAAKGPLPLELLTPIPTPQGDFSAVRVLLWQLDGPQLALIVGLAPTIALARMATLGALPGAAAAALVGLLCLLVTVALARARLRALRRG